MLMIVGLGNPGQKYTDTRHNVGFMFLDDLVGKGGGEFRESKLQAQLLKTSLWSVPLLLAKPSTFMNLSGRAVSMIASYYQVSPGQIVIVHDDLDLDPGRIKMVTDRGPGGHNGIKSIVEHLGTRDFIRFRVGIGRPPERMDPAAFVLSRFGAEEQENIARGFADIEEGIRLIAMDGVVAAMNYVNRKRKK